MRLNYPVYPLGDYNDKAIAGTFFQTELQKVDVRDENAFKIKKILKTRDGGPNKEHFVKWPHWLKTFNSWINANNI